MEPLTAAENLNWCRIKSRIWGYSKISSREQMAFFIPGAADEREAAQNSDVCATRWRHTQGPNVWVWWFKTRLLSLIWGISSLTSTAKVGSAAAILLQARAISPGFCCTPQHIVHRILLASLWQKVFHVGTSRKSPILAMRGGWWLGCSILRESWNAESPRGAAVPAQHTLQQPSIKTHYRTQMSSHNSLTVPVTSTLEMWS